jgi:hypothetical protein
MRTYWNQPRGETEQQSKHCVWVSLNPQTYVHTHTHVFIYVYIYIYIDIEFIYTHTYENSSASGLKNRASVNIYVCVCMYICIWLHTNHKMLKCAARLRLAHKNLESRLAHKNLESRLAHNSLKNPGICNMQDVTEISTYLDSEHDGEGREGHKCAESEIKSLKNKNHQVRSDRIL